MHGDHSAGLAHFRKLIEARRLERQKRRKVAADLTAKMRAPLLKQWKSDPDVTAALEEARKARAAHRKLHPRKGPNGPAMKVPHLKPNPASLLSVFGAPFPVHDGGDFGSGNADWNAMDSGYQFVGDNGGDDTSVSYAGVGMIYSARATGLMRAATYTWYDWYYWVEAGFFTADASGSIGWLIYRLDDGAIVYESYDDLFNGHVGWLDDHSDDGFGAFTDWAWFDVTAGTSYVFMITTEVLAADTSPQSDAYAQIEAKTGFFVFEEFGG